MLLSADDLLTPGCLARATSLMEEYPSVGLTYGFSVEFADGDLPAARTTAKSWIIWQGHDWLTQRCKTGENALHLPRQLSGQAFFARSVAIKSNFPMPRISKCGCERPQFPTSAIWSAADQAYLSYHGHEYA